MARKYIIRLDYGTESGRALLCPGSAGNGEPVVFVSEYGRLPSWFSIVRFFEAWAVYRCDELT